MKNINSIKGKKNIEILSDSMLDKLKGGDKGGIANLGNSVGRRAKCPPPLGDDL